MKWNLSTEIQVQEPSIRPPPPRQTSFSSCLTMFKKGSVMLSSESALGGLSTCNQVPIQTEHTLTAMRSTVRGTNRKETINLTVIFFFDILQ